MDHGLEQTDKDKITNSILEKYAKASVERQKGC